MSRFRTQNARFWRHKKAQKPVFGPFQSGRALIHTPRARWLRPGSPSQEASGRDRSASYGVRRDRFGTGFSKAAQRFNAGWSSPVARQAHNLKVIGSNPIPATRKEPVNSTSWRAFSCSNLPQWSDHGPIQEMLMNTRLSHAVAWCAGSSVSQIWHTKSGALFVKRSCING